MAVYSVQKYQFNVPKNEDWKLASKITIFRKRGSVTKVTFALHHYFSLLNDLSNRILSRLPLFYQPAAADK